MMTPNFAYSKGRKYFYYKCVSVNKLDKTACEIGSVPARELESIILDRLAFLSKNKALLEGIVARARAMSDSGIPAKRQERTEALAQIARTEGKLRNLTSILAEQGKESPQYQVLMGSLGEVESKRREFERKVVALEQEIQDLESRQVDAEVIQRNLTNFSEALQRLPLDHRKELVALLVREVVYAEKDSKIKLILRPLPDLGWEVEGDRISFDERQTWLRSIYTYQGSRELKSPVVIWHETRFGTVLAAKGRQEIVDLNAFREHQAVLAKKVRKPHPPHVQTSLKRAHELAARLAADPGLTRDALAKEAGIHPGHLTRLLRLPNLAPEIQRHILALPPCHGWGPITERALRPITRCRDHEDQVRRFNEILKAKEISNETIDA